MSDPTALPAALADPCIVMVAPTGARRRRGEHPALPITVPEIVLTARACAAAGASALHLHVRDGAERHSIEPEHYRAALEALADLDLPLQITSEAGGRYDAARQMAVLRELRPAAVSLGLRELMPEGSDPGPAREFFAFLVDARISPQFILYDPAEVDRFNALRDAGVIAQANPFVIFVLGRYVREGHVTSPADLLPFLAAHKDRSPWMVCAFGRTETAVLAAAASLGGHVRVGFENNLLGVDGMPAADNAQRVATMVDLLGRIGRPVATPMQSRAFFANAAS